MKELKYNSNIFHVTACMPFFVNTAVLEDRLDDIFGASTIWEL